MNNPQKISFKKKLALNLHKKYVDVQTELHELKYFFWECTLRCNLNCLHCGSDCHKESKVANMPIDDFLKVTEQISKNQNPHKTMIVLTGGEPLMRKDLEEFGEKITKQGFPWGMVTNGLTLTKERFNSLLNAGLGSITVSLDGFEEAHNWLRNNKKSFEKAVEAIKMIVKQPGIVYDVVTCVNGKNIDDLERFKEFLIEIGVKNWRLFTIFPTGRAKTNTFLNISNEQFVDLMEFIKQSRKEKRINVSYSCEGFLGNYENEVRDGYFFCHAGVHIGSVLVDGSISACPNINHSFIQGNIYKDDFLDVWNNKFKVMRDRSWTKKRICKNCDVYKYCNGNGIHLYENTEDDVQMCHYNKLSPTNSSPLSTKRKNDRLKTED
ncbi:MAG: TIGR04133 family radical SAM/SPASM protein [Bacteroidales bacterium]|nr:TIGR04133 family radical SAM/SPASM protein [Bacteroidales bacterium]